MNILQPITGTLAYILNLHYELVTYLATSVYNAALTIVYILQTVSLGLEQIWSATKTLLLDSFDVFIYLGKVAVWFTAWLAIKLENSLLILEAFLYSVCLRVVDAVSALVSLTASALGYLLWLIQLPYTFLLFVNNHMLWCYTELCKVLHTFNTAIMEMVTNVLYHILLIPYYITSYTCQLVHALVAVLMRIGQKLLYITGDSWLRVKVVSINITERLASMSVSVSNTYLISIQRVFSHIHFYTWSFFMWISAITDQVYFADLQLLFGDRLNLGNLLLSICWIPFKTTSIVVKDVLLCINKFLYVNVPLSEKPYPVTYPVPNIPRDIYCVFEEILWLFWLTIITNWQELFMITTILTGIFLITKRHNIVMRREELDDGLDEDGLPVDDTSDMEDEIGPTTIQVPFTRTRRETRSRSQTPDLSTPGAETRYLHKLKRTLDEEVNTRRCVVCQHYSRNILLIPCKHVCLCADCVQEVLQRHPPTCPLCRKRIQQVIDVYL